VYFLIIGPYRRRFEHATKVSKKQVFYFTTGIVLLYFVKGGPIDLIGHIILLASDRSKGLLPIRLILVGIAVSAGFSAISLFFSLKLNDET
ncbi:hypothetical protein ACT453_48610, partial [Bacillus sp. D-CC]